MPEETQQEPKTLVAPRELYALYELLYEREWNREKGAFKNPVLVMRSLLHYGRLAAKRLVDAFDRLTALEAERAALRERLAALEAWRQKIDAERAEVERQVATMIEAGALPSFPPDAARRGVPAETPSAGAPVVPLKPMTTTKKGEGKKEPTTNKDGAAS